MKKSVMLLAFSLLLPALVLSQTVPLTILHTNDTHSHLLPFSYPAVVPPGSDLAGLTVRTEIGGIARRATLVRRLREELGKQGTTVWLVDAGDFSDGTPFSIEYHGEADAAAMNAVGYDFGALGNHEFNNPLARLKNLISMFRYPVLCANVTETSTGRLLTRASEIRTLGGIKIGIFGLVTHDTAMYPAAREGLTVSDEIKTSQEMVHMLRPNADIVIAISHSGELLDEKIAAAVQGIDVIVGGHSHTRLPSGDFVWRSDQLKAKEVNGTVIVQAHQWGGELGRLDLLFEKDEQSTWHVERYRARLIPVTPDIPENSEVASVVERYWKPIAARYGKIIGQAAADFMERGDDLANYNLVADSVRQTYGTEIDLENMGGVRAPLLKGTITLENLADMDPFDNTVVTFRVSGRMLKTILETSRPAVSGLRYRIENNTLTSVTVGGQPLREDRVYTGTTNSYFARTALKEIETRDTGKQRLEVLIEYIHNTGTVRPVFDGRRVIIG